MSFAPGHHAQKFGGYDRAPSTRSSIIDFPADTTEFIGSDPVVSELLSLARQVADTNATVLITGESGTGKELFAKIIREFSVRPDPFVAVNCAAIPESLQESEFFGHLKGAFTGASERKIGKLERANGGTLFLDEIGEMSRSLQAALLRTLQSGEYSPVGSSETRYCDLRVIAAANRRLEDLVESGQFRQDLFYRLNIIRLDVPALRERKGDIPELATHFVRTVSASYGRPVPAIGPEAMAVLMGYDYPGNVRELENFIRRAVILCNSDAIQINHFPDELKRSTPEVRVGEDLGQFQAAKAKAVEAFERAYLTSALSKCGGIVSRASQFSGLSERNFHEKLKRYKINAKSFRMPRG